MTSQAQNRGSSYLKGRLSIDWELVDMVDHNTGFSGAIYLVNTAWANAISPQTAYGPFRKRSYGRYNS